MAQSQLKGGKGKEGNVYTLSNRLTVRANTIHGVVLTMILKKRTESGNHMAREVSISYSALKSLQNVADKVDQVIQSKEKYTMLNYHARSKYIAVKNDEHEITVSLETRNVRDLNLLNMYSMTLTLLEWGKFVQVFPQLIHDLEDLYQKRHTYCELAGKDLKVKKMKWIHIVDNLPKEASDIVFYSKKHALWDAMEQTGDDNPENYKIVEVEQPCPRMINLMSQVVQYCFLIFIELMYLRDNGRMEVDGPGNDRFWFEDGQHKSARIHNMMESHIKFYFPKVKTLLTPSNGFLKTVFTKCCLMMQLIRYKYFTPDELLSEVVQKRFGNDEMLMKELYYLHKYASESNRGEIWLIREAVNNMGPCFDLDLEMVNVSWLEQRVEEVLHVANPRPVSESEEEEGESDKENHSCRVKRKDVVISLQVFFVV